MRKPLASLADYSTDQSKETRYGIHSTRESLNLGTRQGVSYLTLDRAKNWIADLPENVPDEVVAAYAVG